MSGVSDVLPLLDLIGGLAFLAVCKLLAQHIPQLLLPLHLTDGERRRAEDPFAIEFGELDQWTVPVP